ncbi:hypothetical protein [Herbiconiux ginsengi]|uniref:Uncharacterized protein n=1 Tax=Herbiconiux ginsengi TaxID=381665 RepID=A0A1H3TVG0_9MICO|nr:hypothetical protein [Herbiconiux ginsengi]SDZ54223.1 hypothetical protein SAMN05216554_4526 [Herbiconiux ginsengi]
MPLPIATAPLSASFVMALGCAAGTTRLVDDQNVRNLDTLVTTLPLPVSLSDPSDR